MDNVKIKKASIKDGLFLSGEYVETLPNHTKKDVKFSCTEPIHSDLKDAFDKLHVHLAVICDQVKDPKKGAFAQAEFEGFFINGFTIGGNDENEGVTISGRRDGRYGSVNLNTPLTKFDSSEYPFVSELGEQVEAAIYEVEQYLFNDKHAPQRQLEMEFPEAAGEGAEEE